LAESVPDDKFDNHMKIARESDMDALQKVFISQNNESSARKEKYAGIKSSVY
jgi:hypothetical protein